MSRQPRFQLHHVEQSEAIFSTHLREGNERAIHGVRGLKKKTVGLGIIIGMFQDEVRRFEFELSEQRLKRSTT